MCDTFKRSAMSRRTMARSSCDRICRCARANLPCRQSCPIPWAACEYGHVHHSACTCGAGRALVHASRYRRRDLFRTRHFGPPATWKVSPRRGRALYSIIRYAHALPISSVPGPVYLSGTVDPQCRRGPGRTCLPSLDMTLREPQSGKVPRKPLGNWQFVGCNPQWAAGDGRAAARRPVRLVPT